MQYRILKSGLEVFDLARAYGLGIILRRLILLCGKRERVTVEDAGACYIVEGPEIEQVPNGVEENARWLALFEPNDDWAKLFLTVLRTPTLKSEKGKQKASELEKRISPMPTILLRSLRQILKDARKARPVTFSGSKSKGSETLLQTLEPTASKGLRNPFRNSYSEGGNLYIPEDQWALANVGAANVVYWTWGDVLTSVYPVPILATIENHEDIRDTVAGESTCKISGLCAAVHCTLHYAKAIRDRKAGDPRFSDRYSRFIFRAFSKTGNQWKPAGGGSVDPALFDSLLEGDLRLAEQVFHTWDHLFRLGSTLGKEDLALSLAQFLAHPSLDSYLEHSKILSRTILRKEVKTENLYTENNLKEVLQHVGA
jgi:hypothetical protein